MIVVDASALAPALVDDGRFGATARARFTAEVLIAPQIIDLEVASALRGQVRGGNVNPVRAEQALASLAALPFERVAHTPLMTRCWQLRDNLTVYDASYVAVAELFDATLVTGDARLARATGPRCQVELLSAA